MINLNTKDGREKANIYIKLALLIIGGVWVLLSGTDLIDKNSKQLGTEAIPNAKAELEVTWDNKFEDENDDRFCLLDGTYSLTNVGNLTFRVDTIKFTLYRAQNVPRPSDGNLVSAYTIYPRLFPREFEEGPVPYPAEWIEESVTQLPVDVFLSKGNQVSRTFGFVVKDERMDPPLSHLWHSYVVVANATGGLPNKEGGWIAKILERISYFISGRYPTTFRPRDLQEISKLAPICKGNGKKDEETAKMKPK